MGRSLHKMTCRLPGTLPGMQAHRFATAKLAGSA